MSRINHRSLSLAAALLALGAIAAPLSGARAAEPTAGTYAMGGLGASWLRDSGLSGSGVSRSVDFDRGWTGLGAVGHGFGNGVRLEAELGFRHNRADSGGSMDATSVMGNALYDFQTSGPFTPYVGAGLGAVRVQPNNLVVPGFSATIDDGETVPAWQAIAGVAYDLNPNWKLDLGYRYLETADAGFTDSQGRGVDGEYRDHSLLLGLRYAFGPGGSMAK
jgi:OOP family OmpA-OmpF porin